MADMMDDYARQLTGQKELIGAQSDASLKPYLPTIHQQLQDSQAIILQQIDPKKVVNEVLLELSGLKENSDGDFVRIRKPYMNRRGLDNIRIRMKATINQNTIMSSLEDKDIRNLMLQLARDLAFDIALNWQEYGIRDRAICNTVMNIILLNSFIALKRSEGQNEKRFLKGIAFENVGGATTAANKRKEGGWDSLVKKIRL